MILNFGRLQVGRKTLEITESRLKPSETRLEPFEVRGGWAFNYFLILPPYNH